MKIARILALVTVTDLISLGRGQDSDPTPLCNKENEQFTIDFVKDSTAVNLQLMWDKTMVSIPLK